MDGVEIMLLKNKRTRDGVMIGKRRTMQVTTKVKITLIEKEMEIGITRILVKTKTIKVMIGSKAIMEEDKIIRKVGMKEGLVIKGIMALRIEGIIHSTNLAGKIIGAFLQIK